jgi:hypothetical protein
MWNKLHVCGIAVCKLGLFIRMKDLYIAVSVRPRVFGSSSFDLFSVIFFFCM